MQYFCTSPALFNTVWDVVVKTAAITSQRNFLHSRPPWRTAPSSASQLSVIHLTDETGPAAQDLRRVFFRSVFSEHRVLIFPASFIIYSLSSHSSNLWFESISCRSFVLLVYLAPHAGLLVGLSWRWSCGFTVMSQACYASAGRLPPPTDR